MDEDEPTAPIPVGREIRGTRMGPKGIVVTECTNNGVYVGGWRQNVLGRVISVVGFDETTEAGATDPKSGLVIHSSNKRAKTGKQHTVTAILLT